MAFGLRTYGANGALQINENSFTIRVVLSVTVATGDTGWTADGVGAYKQWAVDGNSSNCVAFVLPTGSYDATATQFETQMLDGVVRVYNYLRGYSGWPAAPHQTMRLIVMRFA